MGSGGDGDSVMPGGILAGVAPVPLAVVAVNELCGECFVGEWPPCAGMLPFSKCAALYISRLMAGVLRADSVTGPWS